ncbi:MAG: glycoside hydrolase family 3 C-terminal domain-containing protein [Bacteroidales bacterium]|nr:glycoside hydrolase family 3 C-terminal domain-containing protein [Bacteroidales bacterium]
MKENSPLYLNSSVPVERRVDDLMSRMTLKEKVGQMNQRIGESFFTKDRENLKMNMLNDLQNGLVGSYLMIENAEEYNKLQRIATTSGLKIPFLNAIDAIHGLGLYYGATVYPTAISQATAFDPKMVEQINAQTAVEMRATGYHWAFWPYMSVTRDPRWGRVGENFGEDPLVVSTMAVAAIKGLQGDDYTAPDKVIACAKQVLSDSHPNNGVNVSPAVMSDRLLKEVYLPPLEACIQAGARTLMPAHNEINGVPSHANKELLHDLVRETYGFDGYIVSDWKDIEKLDNFHKVAPNQKEAVKLAINAGVDIHMFGDNFVDELVELVEEGQVPMERVDRTVRAILTDKFRMGLFENPFVDEDKVNDIIANPEHRQLALESARKSIVLLKNEKNTLPLSKSLQKILVTGPLADHNAIVGDWVHSQPDENIITVIEGIRELAGQQMDVEFYNPGDIFDVNEESIAEAVKRSKDADAVVLVIGDNDNRTQTDWNLNHFHKNRTGGENVDRADITLSGMQEELAKALSATGKPVVVVLINGRPLAVEWIAENIPAVIEAWQPGMKGGQAIAEVLFGDYNPSGRLPMTIPRNGGQIPIFYNHRPSMFAHYYSDIKKGPLYWFGHGLSYTTFVYHDLNVPETIVKDQEIPVSVMVKNTGVLAGDEIVLLYVNDKYSSVTTPVKELKAFTRVHLEPGEEKEVKFNLPFEALSLLDKELKKVVEPGEFEVMVGDLMKTFEWTEK